MRTKALTFALAAAASLAACSALHMDSEPGHSKDTADCDGHARVCKVAITVNRCASHDKSAITARPDPRHIPRNRWVIQWEIATPGYEFARGDGITFKSGTPPGIFTGGTGSGNKYQFVDNNAQGGGVIHYYNVHIVRAGGGECLTYDPEVSND